jgi:nucleoside-diphosphate-sugar epimerase
MNKQSKNILITGNTGFVGTNLTLYLNSLGYTTTGITRTPKTTNEINYNSLSTEIWDESDAIIHLAGKAHDLKNTSNEQEYFEVNTELTKTLYQQFLKSTCKVFIYMSSVKAVADKVATTLTEDVEPTPATPYGKSKLAAEQYLLSQKLPKGKFLYILRPCMIHGPGNKGNLNILYKLVSKGIPYPLGAFKNKRSFVSIENLNFIILELLKQKPSSGVYNVADDGAIATTDLIKLMSESLDKKPRIVSVTPEFVKVLATFGTLVKLPFTKEKLQKLTENYVVSNQKIKDTLNIQLPVSTKKGLIRTIKSFNNK